MSRGEERTERRLRGVRAPDEDDASRRAWPAVADAFETRDVSRRRRRTLPAAAVVAVLLLGVGSLSPPGRAIAQWARRVVNPVHTPRPQPVVLGIPGRMIVSHSGGISMLRPDGSGRALGTFSDGAWSPHCRFVAATGGRTIAAIDPDTAEVRWTRTRPGVVSDPRWAPSGFRVAYLANHKELRVVRGDGVNDRRLIAAVADVAPAWRPGSDVNVLAYATRRGVVQVIDVDTGEALARVDVGRPVRSLNWTAGGRDLVVTDEAGVLAVALRTGRRTRIRQLRAAPVALSVSPIRREIAVLPATSSRPTLIAINTPGRVRALAHRAPISDLRFAPDGRRVLLASASSDSWEVVSVEHTGAAPRFESVSTRPITGSTADPAFPIVRDWCADSRP